MENKSIFLGHEGLTSTSANFIANLAKEIIREDMAKLADYNFIDTTVELVDGQSSNVIRRGMTEEELAETIPTLERVAKMKALIGWLREGIKAKEHLRDEVEAMTSEDVCKKLGIDDGEEAKDIWLNLMTEEEYVETLPIDERRRWETLKTSVAVFGKFIHQDGDFAKARQAMLDNLKAPNEFCRNLTGSYITAHAPSLPTECVTQTYLAVQQQHRALQAELNSMTFKMEEAIHQENARRRAEYAQKVEETKMMLRLIRSRVDEWKEKETRRISGLKIVIPQELQGICDEVSRAGK